ncbi:MAG: hypothetical protein AB1813_21810 [Verrucomicrobiota bacterium]
MWANISGAVSSNYSISSVQSSHNGYYRVSATNTQGTVTSTSSRLVYYDTASKPITNYLYVASSNVFKMTQLEVPDYEYIVQASTDLSNWVAIATNTVPFTNFFSASNGYRFYKSKFVQ